MKTRGLRLQSVDGKIKAMLRNLSLRGLAALTILVVGLGLVQAQADAASEGGSLVLVKMGISSLTKAQQVDLWRRLDRYAEMDAVLDFCGRKLSLQRRTWSAVAPCVDIASLRRVASAFRSKKARYVADLETAYPEPEKKAVLCESFKPKFPELIRVLDAHIAEATTMCSACLWC